MRCIYCNTDTELTVSDIIPWSLTGAKIRRQFVCHTHNGFTNDNYEKEIIARLAPFRNELGLTERDGSPVRFVGDFSIDGITFKNTSVSNRRSVLGIKSRLLSTTDITGKKTIVGDIGQILKIKGASKEKIKYIDAKSAMISSKINLHDAFISKSALHVAAKVAYEWHCYINDISEYDPLIYSSIVSYILSPESDRSPVSIINDVNVWKLMDICSRTGTNMLFEYVEDDGSTYVVFGLWGVILYKIKICDIDTIKHESEDHNIYKVYLYHTDGTESSTVFGIMGKLSIKAENAEKGFSSITLELKRRLEKLGNRDISIEYLTNGVQKIRALINKYERKHCTLAELLDYGADDPFTVIYILETLYQNKAEYNHELSFNQNLSNILCVSDQLLITEKQKETVLARYAEMDKDGIFLEMLINAIDFFDSIVAINAGK